MTKVHLAAEIIFSIYYSFFELGSRTFNGNCCDFLGIYPSLSLWKVSWQFLHDKSSHFYSETSILSKKSI